MQNYCLATTPQPWKAYVMHEEEGQDMCPASKGLLSKPWKQGKQRALCSGHVLAGLQAKGRALCLAVGCEGLGWHWHCPRVPSLQHGTGWSPELCLQLDPGTPGCVLRGGSLPYLSIEGCSSSAAFQHILPLPWSWIFGCSAPEPLHNLSISSCWPGCLSP